MQLLNIFLLVQKSRKYDITTRQLKQAYIALWFHLQKQLMVPDKRHSTTKKEKEFG